MKKQLRALITVEPGQRRIRLSSYQQEIWWALVYTDKPYKQIAHDLKVSFRAATRDIYWLYAALGVTGGRLELMNREIKRLARLKSEAA